MTTPTTTVTEGRAELVVPVSEDPRHGADKGPGRVEEGLFFNPAMRFNRDLSILVLEERAWAHPSQRPFEVYDGLAATGARSVRIALECDPKERPILVHANDRDAGAVALIEANVRHNKVADKVRVTQADVIQGASTDRYDHIDVDPYGSPIPFLDIALQRIRNHGTIALTATDVTALCGVYPNVALRRYDAIPWHGPAMHEVALRILAGTAVRNAARYDLALRPIVAHATDHYVRVYLAARRGAERADANLALIGHAVELADGTRGVYAQNEPPPQEVVRLAGPLWIGPLQEQGFITRLLQRLDDHPRLDRPPLQRFLERAEAEADAAPLHYEMGETARRLKLSPPTMASLFEALGRAGFRATRTHVADDAFKTDAPAPVIHEAFRAAATQRS